MPPSFPGRLAHASPIPPFSLLFPPAESGIDGRDIAAAYDKFEKGEGVSLSVPSSSNQTVKESLRLLQLIRAYQVSGHMASTLDPLGLKQRPPVEVLDPASYGFTEADLDREFFIGTFDIQGFMSEERPTRTLREIITRLRETYCGHIGYEYMHINDREKCNWLRERIETVRPEPFSLEKKKLVLDRLSWSEMFESFLANKYTAAKRFGLEGCEALIPGLKAAIDTSAGLGVNSVVIGMPHRGRLNILANVMRKPLEQVFSEFTGIKPADGEHYTGSGDVKYHLGTSYDRPTLAGSNIHLSLLANPSHLEAVNTVALGKVRAKQYFANDPNHDHVMPVLMHGDGAFAGQGIVYETLDMSQLPDYTVGGTLHVVVNNQVAFTTDPYKSRSSPYATDVAKSLQAPVFHVNGDDAESVVRVFELAAEWRARWKTDVVVDLVGYRRYGHNEIDEPSFTQPLMYKAIKKHPNPQQIYVQQLLAEKSVPEAEIKQITDAVQSKLHEAFEASKNYKPVPGDWLGSAWAGFNSPAQVAKIRDTGVPRDALIAVGEAITEIPKDFKVHRSIAKVYEARAKMVAEQQGVDWGFAEALAFGTLLAEGTHVRLSGQDVERGTFSHRHAVLHDQTNNETYVPLKHVFAGQRPDQFSISNSSLSEFGVLGFELGYSMENPDSLVLWEAQFGDFANGAQIMFDQFISSGEAKWLRQSGLTVLLPHGYDGQGPEHSSCRVERYLQMVDEDPYTLPEIDESRWFTGGHLGSQIQKTNMQVVNCTTPANYFHVLRRQIHRQFRKPLIVVAPKNLLRHPLARSPLTEFDDKAEDAGIQGVRFKRVIMDEGKQDRSPFPEPDERTKRVVFCSGKLYYELATERAKQDKQDDIAIVRIEQLAPFPFDLVMRELRRYPNAEVVWAQEEPKNMGAYLHVQPRIQTCIEGVGREAPLRIKYAGRKVSAATATGFGSVHAAEQAAVIRDALTI